jgi:hypothetical protein
MCHIFYVLKVGWEHRRSCRKVADRRLAQQGLTSHALKNKKGTSAKHKFHSLCPDQLSTLSSRIL